MLWIFGYKTSVFFFLLWFFGNSLIVLYFSNFFRYPCHYICKYFNFKKIEFECVVTIEKFVLLNDIWAKLCIGTILNMHGILRICHWSKISRKKSDKDSQTLRCINHKHPIELQSRMINVAAVYMWPLIRNRWTQFCRAM